MDWGFIRRQCFEVDVTSECANGGNYVRGTILCCKRLISSVESVERGGNGVWIEGWIVFEYCSYDCRTDEFIDWRLVE